ncbi:hypothetical protein FZC35_00860 [Candidatus Cytomitobacter indipagum]|uniref:Uncharacterized protein n=1 Tax=Candidatus Cytomitobacter indipagum TaxID=2601575 RepID=A0A5C0UE54_9PROT|nr:hypothetical protein [Candidatus Cytomitobacter indipagum]QEK37933.1 hypothetical protein FZC35_00860 [Candidatus Cytomitobacter indipagum]
MIREMLIGRIVVEAKSNNGIKIQKKIFCKQHFAEFCSIINANSKNNYGVPNDMSDKKYLENVVGVPKYPMASEEEYLKFQAL